MNTEQYRPDFEYWYDIEFSNLHGPLVRFDYSYENTDHALMWEAYQAGRAALQSQHDEETKNLRDALWIADRKIDALQSQDREDAERLDFLDAKNMPYKMGWNVGIGPAGNVSISSVIQLGGAVTTIRAAIDHARRVEGGGE